MGDADEQERPRTAAGLPGVYSWRKESGRPCRPSLVIAKLKLLLNPGVYQRKYEDTHVCTGSSKDRNGHVFRTVACLSCYPNRPCTCFKLDVLVATVKANKRNLLLATPKTSQCQSEKNLKGCAGEEPVR